jgi:hypothetical protein
MQALTLTQLFGASATQSATELVIKKNDLVAVGLTPASSNRAEQLLVGILLKALENFQGELTDPQGNKVTDPQGQTINYDNSSRYLLLLIEPWNGYVQELFGGYRFRDTIIIHYFSEYAN